jgi:hypothetical protein
MLHANGQTGTNPIKPHHGMAVPSPPAGLTEQLLAAQFPLGAGGLH